MDQPLNELVEEVDVNDGPNEDEGRVFWRKPVELANLLHFRVLKATPKDSANVLDLDAACSALVSDIAPSIERMCHGMSAIKVWPSLHVRYESANPVEADGKTFDWHLRASHSIIELGQTALNQVGQLKTPCAWQMHNFGQKFQSENAKFIREKSGLFLAEIYSLNLNIVRFSPIDGSGFKKLPPFLANKKAIINVQNTDDRCFGYAVLAALLPDDPNRHDCLPERYTEDLFEEHGLDLLEYALLSLIDLC
jgi:hypothetical protein